MHKSIFEIQEDIELALSKKHIKQLVLDELTSDMDMLDKVIDGMEYLKAWTETDSSYESKAQRKELLASLDLKDVVEDIYVAVLSMRSDTTLNNLVCQLAGMFKFEEAYQGLTLCAEIIAVLANTGIYHLNKPSKYSSTWVVSNYNLSDELMEHIENAQYLPPSKSVPKYLINNRSSGYRTIKGDSLILGGSLNHHNEDISLDVLNTMNKIPLKLCPFMLAISQESEKDLDVIEDFKGTQREYAKAVDQQKLNWELFLKRSELAYELMDGQTFYLTNKVDKRGRIYSQGYAINIQGNSYQKACIDLANTETIEIPEGYF